MKKLPTSLFVHNRPTVEIKKKKCLFLTRTSNQTRERDFFLVTPHRPTLGLLSPRSVLTPRIHTVDDLPFKLLFLEHIKIYLSYCIKFPSAAKTKYYQLDDF